jgi:CBS domain-containing protein
MTHISELIAGKPLFHVRTTDTVREAARLMSELNIGATAVLDGERLAGVFSERDLMTRVVAQSLDPDATTVGDVMTCELAVADPADDIAAALQKMSTLGCRHLPVVESGNLIGMISLRDLLQTDSQTSRARATFLNELVTYSPDYET